MASINGVPLNLTDIKIKNTHNNVYSDIPGVAGGTIYDMGYSGLTIEISGWELSDGAYRSVLKELMKRGQSSLVIFACWEYRVYGGSVNRSLGTTANYYPRTVSLKSEDPYEYSLYPNSRIKSITSNYQSWTADDSGNTITNEQSTSTPVDIEVYGHTNRSSIMTEKAYTWSRLNTTNYSESGKLYVLKYTETYIPKSGRRLHITNVGADVAGFNERASARMQVRYSTGGAETIICEFDVAWGAVQQYYTFSEAVDVYINEGSTLYISYYLVSGSDGYVVNAKNLTSVVSECRFKSTLGVSVYNSADNTVVTHVCNRLPTNARLRLNTDGSGDFQYHVADLSTTDYWTDEGYYLDNCEHLNGLKINSSGCFIYDFDTKYPMTGNITVACTYSVVGAFFIRYALDDGTGNPGKFTSVAVYADGSATTSVAINLAGQTKFYIEFATAGGSEVTLTYIDVSVQISPLTAVFPVIVGNGVTNTFVANQSAGTGIYCSILLWYEERRWG